MNLILTGHGIRLTGPTIHLITEALQGKMRSEKKQLIKKHSKGRTNQRNDQPNEPQNYLFACKKEISHSSSYISNICLS